MNTNTIINTVVTNNNGAINDHTGKVIELLGICMLKGGEIGALLKTNKHYSINELYVKDGVAHVSTSSITGTVSPEDDLTTVEGIREFNKTLTFDFLHISKVVIIVNADDHNCYVEDTDKPLFRSPMIPQ